MCLERLGSGAATATVGVMPGGTVALGELVVTGTGLQRWRELGNAAAAIQVDDELERAAPVTLTNLLQGRAAGAQVLQSSAAVGAASAVKIRGSGSISLSDTPLIYIDGSRVRSSAGGTPTRPCRTCPSLHSSRPASPPPSHPRPHGPPAPALP